MKSTFTRVAATVAIITALGITGTTFAHGTDDRPGDDISYEQDDTFKQNVLVQSCTKDSNTANAIISVTPNAADLEQQLEQRKIDKAGLSGIIRSSIKAAWESAVSQHNVQDILDKTPGASADLSAALMNAAQSIESKTGITIDKIGVLNYNPTPGCN